jgi:hypothetical protein
VTTLILHMVISGLAIAINPVPIIAALIMPATRRPVVNGLVYVGTLIAVMALVGVVVLLTLHGVAASGGGTTHTVLNILWLAIGVGFLAAFAIMLAKRPAPGKEHDEPGWMKRIEDMGPAGAAFVGVLLVNYELELPALTTILGADVSKVDAFLALAILVCVACSTPTATVAAYTAAPHATAKVMARGKALLTRYHRPILLLVFGAVGVYYLYKGLAGLL